ncbi:MAG: hypothetical protein HOQ05_08810 [Corynebacteriales bacterium]|nr:hypothetical protein [Mycobacteriales bacterium]
MKPDPLWSEYAEAMRGLAQVPASRDERLAQARAEQESALSAAKSLRDAELRRCAEWVLQARRAMSNAQARLVASKVLIPDTLGAPSVAETDPELLLGEVRSGVREFEGALANLRTAGRRMADDESAAQVLARRRLFLRRRLMAAGAVGAVLLLLIVFAWS